MRTSEDYMNELREFVAEVNKEHELRERARPAVEDPDLEDLLGVGDPQDQKEDPQ